MSVLGCIRMKIATGRVDAVAGQRLLGWIEDLAAEKSERVAAAEAARMAVAEVGDLASKDAARRADLALRTIEAQLEGLNRVSVYEAGIDALRQQKGDFGFGDKRPVTMAMGLLPMKLGEDRTPVIGRAFRTLFSRDMHEVVAGPNVHYLARDLRGRAHALLSQSLEALRPKALGLKTDLVLDSELGRALVNGATDVSPAAREAAEAFRRVDQFLVDEWNKAGGDLLPRTNYLPQSHDHAKVAATTFESWADFVAPKLDRSRMLDRQSGEALSDSRLRDVLRQVYDSISRKGLDDVPPDSAFRGGTRLADRRQDARILEFKDFENWAAYKERFGNSAGVADTLMQHIERMSSDIAQLRILGPDPKAFRRFIENTYAQRIAALGGDAAVDDAKAMAGNTRALRRAEAALRRDMKHTLNLMDEVTGATNMPVDMELARRMSDVRSALSSAQLGSAILSSLADTGSLAMTARINGLEATAVLKRAVSDMADGTSEIRAAQAGLVADTLMQAAREADSYMGEALTSTTIAKISNAAIRASGLRRWTAVMRNAFGMEYMAHLANHADKTLAELPQGFRDGFSRHGLTDADWDAIRRSPVYEPREGARFLRPVDVADRQASERLLQLINTELDHAVIENDPHARALLLQGTQRGTGPGEVLRSAALYKTFPVTFFTKHFSRAFARGWDGTRLSHGALTLVAVWSMGVLSMQAKEIAQGRDPLPLDPTDEKGRKAWIKALFTSGGLGIYGDLIHQDKTRFGNSWAATLAGAPFGAMEDILGKFALKNVQLLAAGKETHFGGDALYLLSRYMPGTSLWYARLALQRGVWDQLALMVDDRAPERFARIEAEARKNFGQDFWAAPGQMPSRIPDFSAIGGR